MSLLDGIKSPQDLKKLSVPELDILAQEVRDRIIEVVSKTGGHLAPSLGVVELTIALHRTYNCPIDKFIWDVGHQSYVHKILTGRNDNFDSLRQFGGISGFPKRNESECDAFGTGHASTSISAATGIAAGRDAKGEKFNVIAVIGDGALTGGLAFEGLNQAGFLGRELLVVLNDNKMSISPNVGALSKYLNQLITNPMYNKLRRDVYDFLGSLPFSEPARDFARRMEEGLINMLTPGVVFESLGYRYFGPVDGHDIAALLKTLQLIKRLPGPKLLHVHTRKGKGFVPAEDDATAFHGTAAFNPTTGNVTNKPTKPSYTSVFGMELIKLAEEHKDIIAITAAMPDGTGLKAYSKRFPERFFDVGIAEGHAVTFSAGLATQGLKPVVALYSTFMQRAFDMVIHDVALQRLPVVFAVDRAGLVGEDGSTHHGLFDIAYLTCIPGMTVLAPRSDLMLKRIMRFAVNYNHGPVAFRYPRSEAMEEQGNSHEPLIYGKGEILQKGGDLTIIAVGTMSETAQELNKLLAELGLTATIIDPIFLKPIDVEMFRGIFELGKPIIILEEASLIGGFGESLLSTMVRLQVPLPIVKHFAIKDTFVEHGSRGELLNLVELTPQHIFANIISLFNIIV